MNFLRIESETARNFYRDASSLQILPAQEAREELLLTVGTLRSAAEGETPNLTITLRNDSAQCSRLFANPPVGAKAEVRDESATLFSGIVREVSLDGKQCRLSIEA